MTSHHWNNPEPEACICECCVSGFIEVKNASGSVLDYAFIVEVEWSDDKSTVLKRTFTDFSQLRSRLSDAVGPQWRTKIPVIPGKKLFQRNNRDLAEKREPILNKFIRLLVKLAPEVSQHPVLLAFFESRRTDPKKAASCEESEQRALAWQWSSEADAELHDYTACANDFISETEINWTLHPSDSGFVDSVSEHDVDHNSTPSTWIEVPTESVRMTQSDSAVTCTRKEVEDDITMMVDLQDMSRRSHSYYSLCYAADTLSLLDVDTSTPPITESSQKPISSQTIIEESACTTPTPVHNNASTVDSENSEIECNSTPLPSEAS